MHNPPDHALQRIPIESGSSTPASPNNQRVSPLPSLSWGR